MSLKSNSRLYICQRHLTRTCGKYRKRFAFIFFREIIDFPIYLLNQFPLVVTYVSYQIGARSLDYSKDQTNHLVGKIDQF